MSPSFTPAGGVAEPTAPESTPVEGGRLRVRYLRTSAPFYTCPVPVRPPSELLLDVVVSEDNGAVAMNAVDLDVAVEGSNHHEALIRLIDAVEDWLEYLRDEDPQFTPELEPQRHFVGLLDYGRGTWFKALFTA